jgi:ATP-dependent Clp protease ATP-binding subunit ClpC
VARAGAAAVATTSSGVAWALGADHRLTRRAVSAALAGHVHLRAQTATTDASLAETIRRELAPLVSRVALERARQS